MSIRNKRHCEVSQRQRLIHQFGSMPHWNRKLMAVGNEGHEWFSFTKTFNIMLEWGELTRTIACLTHATHPCVCDSIYFKMSKCFSKNSWNKNWNRPSFMDSLNWIWRKPVYIHNEWLIMIWFCMTKIFYQQILGFILKSIKQHFHLAYLFFSFWESPENLTTTILWSK